MTSKATVVQTARGYLHTPFDHQGRLKGIACDCVGLLMMVADDLALVDRHGRPLRKYDYQNYPSQPLDRFVHDECGRRLSGVPVEQMEDGDILTLRVPSVPCHVAFVSTVHGVRSMIHAYISAGAVVENYIDKTWYKRIEGCFRIPGVV